MHAPHASNGTIQAHTSDTLADEVQRRRQEISESLNRGLIERTGGLCSAQPHKGNFTLARAGNQGYHSRLQNGLEAVASIQIQELKSWVELAMLGFPCI